MTQIIRNNFLKKEMHPKQTHRMAPAGIRLTHYCVYVFLGHVFDTPRGQRLGIDRLIGLNIWPSIGQRLLHI